MQPLKIAIAPDSFKGTLTAQEAASCIERGLRRALPHLSATLIPISDGGEGMTDAVLAATGGQRVFCKAADPLGRPRRAAFGLSRDGHFAILEMAAACGLPLLQPTERNPLLTTTRGTGDLIRAALDRGARHIVLGIGGSATNDGGTGMAIALGARFLDRHDRPLGGTGGDLSAIHRIDLSGLDPRISRTRIEVACDVTNPLCGPNGAAHIYGPQKGATPAMVRQLDAGLRQLARVIQRDLGLDVAARPGAGAAGGLGAGLQAFLGARLVRGFPTVARLLDLPRRLQGHDLVIVGEGRMDAQTASGKAPAGVARIARRLDIPVIALCGTLGPGSERLNRIGIGAAFACVTGPYREADLPRLAAPSLVRCATHVGRLLALSLG